MMCSKGRVVQLDDPQTGFSEVQKIKGKIMIHESSY